MDHLQTLSQLIEKCNDYQKPMFLLFIEYTKAFDSIEHAYIWQSLKFRVLIFNNNYKLYLMCYSEV